MSGKLYSFQPTAVLIQCSISGSSKGHLSLSWILLSDGFRDVRGVEAQGELYPEGFFITEQVSPANWSINWRKCGTMFAKYWLYPSSYIPVLPHLVGHHDTISDAPRLCSEQNSCLPSEISFYHQSSRSLCLHPCTIFHSKNLPFGYSFLFSQLGTVKTKSSSFSPIGT